MTPLESRLADEIEQPYAVAVEISMDMELGGAPLSKQAIANRIIAADESLSPAEREKIAA